MHIEYVLLIADSNVHWLKIIMLQWHLFEITSIYKDWLSCYAISLLQSVIIVHLFSFSWMPCAYLVLWPIGSKIKQSCFYSFWCASLIYQSNHRGSIRFLLDLLKGETVKLNGQIELAAALIAKTMFDYSLKYSSNLGVWNLGNNYELQQSVV